MLCLQVPTDSAWVGHALTALDHVLQDHAFCELKAASNAMSLIARHPDDLELVHALTSLAREELDHFERVVFVLQQRGLALGNPEIDWYAAELRKAVATLPRDPALPVLVDRLLVAAVIEARSCERFRLMLDHWTDPSDDLRAFYEELFVCEAKHYRMLCSLAERVARDERRRVPQRLHSLAEREAFIVRRLATRQERRATVHG